MMMGTLVEVPLPGWRGVARPDAATPAGSATGPALPLPDPLNRKAVVISAATAIPAATGRNAPGVTAPAR